MKKGIFCDRRQMWKDCILFSDKLIKKDDKINELYAQFMILEEAEEIRAVIGYEQSEENALIRSCLFTPNVDKQTFLYFLKCFCSI